MILCSFRYHSRARQIGQGLTSASCCLNTAPPLSKCGWSGKHATRIIACTAEVVFFALSHICNFALPVSKYAWCMTRVFEDCKYYGNAARKLKTKCNFQIMMRSTFKANAHFKDLPKNRYHWKMNALEKHKNVTCLLEILSK